MTNASQFGWHFSRRSSSDVEHDPTEADQFNSEDMGRDQSLIREATQNSQDNRRDTTQPVRVRLAQVKGPEVGKLIAELTAELPARLESSGIDVPESDGDSALLVEDFGTRGLTGAWSDDADEGSFRSFWFRHGRSFKGGQQGGRWGLGKLVFPMSSALRCHFGLTVRESEAEGLLLGQAVLKTHTLNGLKYAPHGHWGACSGDSISPLSQPAFLKRFSKTFGLERVSEPGLSVVVPRPRIELNADHLTEYVVRNYAFPILTRRLVFDVMGEKIDAASVRAIGRGLLPPGLIDFIDAVYETTDGSMVLTPTPQKEGASFFLREEFFQPEALQSLRKSYADGQHVAMRVPIKLKRAKATAEADSFVDIHLRKAAEGEVGEALCVRGDITVPNEAKRFRSETHFSLLAAEEPLVSEFLGDAENPAHTAWSTTAERFQARWTSYPAPKLRFIRDCVASLHRMIAAGEPTEDKKALLNFFWLPDPAEGTGAKGRPKARKGKVVVKKVIEKPKPERRVNIAQTEGGFTVTPGPGFAGKPLPARLRVEVAYDVLGADPFKAWSPFDFDLAEDELDWKSWTRGTSPRDDASIS